MSKIFLTTLPKTGLHLLRHILGFKREESTTIRSKHDPYGRRGRIFPGGISMHLPWTERMAAGTAGMTRMTLLRDPRDVIVSWFHYVDRRPEAALNKAFAQAPREDRMFLMINMLVRTFEGFTGWLDEDIMVFRYEDLLHRPEIALKPLVPVLDVSLDELVERSKHRESLTFRKGVAGEWKHEFSELDKAVFNNHFAHIMKAWGYE